MKRRLHAAAFALAAVLLAGCGGTSALEAGVLPTPTPAPTAAPTPEPTPEPTPVVETVRFSASGDNLIHEGLYNQARARTNGEGYDFAPAYEAMRGFYQAHDVNWLNQETLINDAYEPSGYPMFSTPGDITDALYDIGFRVFSLSNNHSYDKGAGGIAASREHWAAMPEDVVTAGFYNLADPTADLATQTVNGITIGYLSWTESTNGLPTPADSDYGVIYLDDRETMAAQIAALRPACDVLVASCHWGVEGSHTVTDAQREIAQWLADQGVDLIIGTHPHVTQGAEWLDAADGSPAFVAYSLGNFISAQSEYDNMIGALLSIEFVKTTAPDGSVTVALQNPTLVPTVTQYEAGYANIRVLPYSAYTDELGAAHGNFTMDRAGIEAVLRGSIEEEFLDLETVW